MPRRIFVAVALIDRLLAEAAAAPDREICGLLFGNEARIEEARSTANVAPDTSCWFEIDPAALFAAHRAERAGGPRLIGHYHSHPGGSAEPSPRDLAAAEPGRLWLITGGGVIRAWMAGGDGFREVALLTNC